MKEHAGRCTWQNLSRNADNPVKEPEVKPSTCLFSSEQSSHTCTTNRSSKGQDSLKLHELIFGWSTTVCLFQGISLEKTKS